MQLPKKEVIEATKEKTEFPYLAQKYNVFKVAKPVIKEAISAERIVQAEVFFLENVLKAANPEIKKQK